jgi:hypothetical protein
MFTRPTFVSTRKAASRFLRRPYAPPFFLPGSYLASPPGGHPPCSQQGLRDRHTSGSARTMTSAPSRKCNGTFPWRHPDDRTEIAGGAGGNRADRCCMTSPQSAGRARSTRATSQRAPRLAVPAYRRIFGWQAAGALPIPPRPSTTAP